MDETPSILARNLLPNAEGRHNNHPIRNIGIQVFVNDLSDIGSAEGKNGVIQETLDISQKVEIHEEKLRKYFPYWMEICSKTLRKQALEQGKNPSRKIVLVFPSIDLLTNSKDEPLLPGFWLPETFPFNVRVILSATRDSQAA